MVEITSKLLTELPYHLTCENLAPEWPKQLFNTVSNIGYIIVFLIFVKKHSTNSIIYRSFAGLSLLVGVASIMAHTTMVTLACMVDYAAILFFTLSLMDMNPSSSLNRSQRSWLKRSLSYPGRLMIVLIYLCLQPLNRYVAPGLFISMVITYIVLELKRIKSDGQWGAGQFSRAINWFGLAFLFLALDVIPAFCWPEFHWLQLHGLWHIFSAVSIYHLAGYYSFISTVSKG